MINIKHCQELDCAETLLRKHREHLKEETKKDKTVKHVCGQACHLKEKTEHQATHDWYLSKKR